MGFELVTFSTAHTLLYHPIYRAHVVEEGCYPFEVTLDDQFSTGL